MEPVRIKLYGLITLTKRRYLAQQALSVSMVAALLLMWYFVPRPDAPIVRRVPVERIGGNLPGQSPELPPEASRFLAIWNAIPWIVVGLLLVIAVESTLVLRAFGRRERETASRNSPIPS